MRYRQQIRIYTWTAIGLMMLGFAIRVSYMQNTHPYIDEYFTILAADMVQQHGLPILPSGLFYSHGFLYTYLVAGLGWLVKMAGPTDSILQAEMVYRVPNLLVSAVSMAVLYAVTNQWFTARAALVTLALMVVYPHGIVWGGRVRMYTLVFLFVPLLAYAFYRATLRPTDRRWYYLTLFLAALGLLIHNWMMSLIPVLVIGVVVIAWRCRISTARSWRWWLPGLITITVFGLVSSRLASLWLATPAEVAQDTGWQGLVAATIGRLNLITAVADDSSFWHEFIVANPFNLWILGLAMLGALGLFWLRAQPMESRYFWVLVYLYLLFFGMLAEFLLLLKPELKQPRYAAPILLLGFIILGGWFEIGLRRLSQNIHQRWLATAPFLHKLSLFFTFIFLVVILAGFGSLASWQLPKIFFEGLPAVAYEKAFQFVETNFQRGDSLLSPLPAAGRLYLDSPGYFVAQDADYNFVHLNTQGVLGDRWVGAPWIHTTSEFKEILAESPRTWLVVDAFSFNTQFRSDWKQVMRYNMARIWEEDGVMVFAGEGLVRDIPTEPDIPVGAVLEDKVRLMGYSREFAPGQLQLVLFWQSLAELSANYTTFVHIRNQDGETIAQVDVQPMSGEYPTSRWRVGETVVDEITVPLPAELPSGAYHLLLGLYRWDTLERLAVVNDTTGENAVELEVLAVP